jgi:hypothetical protein
MEARRRLDQLQRALAHRELVYIGPRGEDSYPLVSLGNLGSVVSLIAPAGSGVFESCLERLSGERLDLNSYAHDEDLSAAAARHREALFSRFVRPTALLPYQSSRLFSCAWVTSLDMVLPLGLYHEKQACFDAKPWVELELRRLGVKSISWSYVRSLLTPSILRSLEEGPLVIRSPRSWGGINVSIVHTPRELSELEAFLPDEGYFCISPWIESSISVNVNACVFPGGETSIHGGSLQLLGIGLCTTRPLGYVGNDFGAIATLPTTALANLDAMTRRVGMWMASQGFLGAFGLDALVCDEDVLFVEVNPRFQGSSAVAARIDEQLSRSNQYFEHAAAFLGLDPPDGMSLRELVRRQSALAQVVVYNRENQMLRLTRRPAVENCELRLLPGEGVSVHPNGTLAALCFEAVVTRSGRELSQEAERAVHAVAGSFSTLPR